MTLRVTLEDLTTSGMAVTGHGESVAAEHATADGRIADAQSGWSGTSSAALATKATAWTQATAELLTRMFDHAQGLHDAAQAHASGEGQSSARMREVAAEAAGRQCP